MTTSTSQASAAAATVNGRVVPSGSAGLWVTMITSFWVFPIGHGPSPRRTKNTISPFSSCQLHHLVAGALGPRRDVGDRPPVGGDHLEHIPGPKPLHRLGGLDDRHRAEQPPHVEDHCLLYAWLPAVTTLGRRFLERFWIPEDGTVAFALDGDKRRVRTPTSNPGHCLWLGLVDHERAASVAERLMRPDLFTGFGLRTLSSDHPAYDPHSYQRGSVWPHDTMIAAAGMRRCGRDEDAWHLIDGILAAAALDGFQLPELFAGLQRQPPDTPVPYERANVPQAWAAGSVFHAVRILLGLEPDVPNGRIYLNPALPAWCPEIVLDNLRVGAQRIGISARRRSDGSSVAEVGGRIGPLQVIAGPPPWWSAEG